MIDVRKRLQEELNVIERELRVELPREILRAREHGDLSENAEYKSAKERQSFLEGRKAQLQQRLAALSLVNLEKIPTDRAAYGSKVVLYEYETEKELKYRLVSAEESDINKGLISITSPIGRSLVGKKVGDSIEIITPSGRKDYEMRNLRTIHDLEESA
jgi:transcription elongation factor GreA